MQAANYAKCSLAYEENKKKNAVNRTFFFHCISTSVFCLFLVFFGGRGRDKQSLNLGCLSLLSELLGFKEVYHYTGFTSEWIFSMCWLLANIAINKFLNLLNLIQ